MGGFSRQGAGDGVGNRGERMKIAFPSSIQAAEHAERCKVVLKGDVPIGVDKNSVDTWMDPSLFHMNTSTGSPPDYFSLAGQNWGFPTYNWEEMAKDNYHW